MTMKRTPIDKDTLHRCKGFPDVRHVDCGGQISIGGEGNVQIPHGFGFVGGEFRIDADRWPAYSGWCMKCQATGYFVRIDKKPKRVNATSAKLRRKLEAVAV